jgi:hypothetical protein
MKYLYNIENKGSFDSSDFNEYAGECSCHADLPKGIPPNIPRSCLLDFCSFDNRPTVYIDATSREKPCEGTFCNAVTNIGNQSASQGGEIAFSNKVTQNCGMGTVNNDKTNIGVAPGSTQGVIGSQAGVTPPPPTSTTPPPPPSTITPPPISKTTPPPPATSPPPPATSPPPSTTTPPPPSTTPPPTDSSETKPDDPESPTTPPAAPTPPKSNNMLLIGGVVVCCCCIIIIAIIVIMMSKKKKGTTSSKSTPTTE